MDFVTQRRNVLEWIKKYKYVLIVLMAGILLMVLPEEHSQETIQQKEEVHPAEEGLQERLSLLLSKVAGAGRVEVLLTENTGEEIIFQMNEDRSTGETGGDLRRDTILVSDGSRKEEGLIKRIDPPSYQGAIILCQGAENAKVRLSLVEAVANATGLSSDRITVLKMN